MNKLLAILAGLSLFGVAAVAQYTPMSVEDASFPLTMDVNDVTVDAGSGVDTATAGALALGAATATSVTLGASDADTTVTGDLNVTGLDIDGTGALTIGAADATSFAIGAADITTTSPGAFTVGSTKAVTLRGKTVDSVAGATAAAAQGTMATSFGAVHYDVITWTNTTAVDTFTDGSDEGESELIFTFPEGRILILGAACNFTVTVGSTFEASDNDHWFVGVGTAAAGDDATLSSTEQDVIAVQDLDTVGGGTQSFEVEVDMTSGGDSVFDGTTTAVKLYMNSCVADTQISANTAWTNAGTLQVVWVFLGDD